MDAETALRIEIGELEEQVTRLEVINRRLEAERDKMRDEFAKTGSLANFYVVELEEAHKQLAEMAIKLGTYTLPPHIEAELQTLRRAAQKK